MKRIYLEINLEQLIDEIKHSPLFRVGNSGARIRGAHAETLKRKELAKRVNLLERGMGWVGGVVGKEEEMFTV